MQKTKIEWADFVWNPIKGLCPVGCWYCYARKIYKRFNLRYARVFNWGELHKPRKLKTPSRIFVCSTMELFHPSISVDWRNYIFNTIEDCPQHTFQILTKMPENIDRPMPDNVWLGITITGEDRQKDYWRIAEFLKHKPRIAFVSIGPLLDNLSNWTLSFFQNFQWIIVGKLSGYGNHRKPKRKWIEEIIYVAKENKTPIFLKNNLKDIWKEPLIQEFPE